jgi:BlaI family penicillinase repressor
MRAGGSSRPTEVEHLILEVLWERGPSTARSIHESLREKKDTNYSTTVKMLSIMLKKGLVKRKETATPHVYQATKSRQVIQRRMLRDLIARAYAGSAGSLVLQALSSQQASAEELSAIRRLLDDLEGKK